MGKRIHEKQSVVSNTNDRHHNPGRVWGILHVIKYHQWRHVKRRLTNKKHEDGIHNTRDGIRETKDDSRVDNMPEHYEPNTTLSNVTAKLVQSTPPTKHSIKSRLKSLIHEELYRKKGRHKRSSTCPTKSQLTSAESVHHRMEVDPVSELLLTTESPKPVIETFESSPIFSEKTINSSDKCVDCGTLFTTDNLDQRKIHKHKKQNLETQNLISPNKGMLEEKAMNAKILTTDASPLLFKDFLDALEVINTNRDFLLRYIQDPGSTPLPIDIHNNQDLRSKSRRANSISFPLSGSSSGSKDSEPSQLIDKMVDKLFKDKEERKLKSSENSHQVSTMVPNNNKSKHILDLKKKIKHIIEERKKEKHRIAMDAVLDKIPHGNKHYSKKPKHFAYDQFKDSTISGLEPKEYGTRGYGNRLCSHSFNKRQASTMRTSSLKESARRYSQLYETCFNSEVNSPKPESLKLKAEEKNSILKTPKSFKRFLSLPNNIKSDFHHSEDPSALLSPRNSVRLFNDDTSTSTCGIDQHRSFDHLYDSKNGVLSHNLSGDKAMQESILNTDQKQILSRSASKSGSCVNDEVKAYNKSKQIDGLGNLREDDDHDDDASCNEHVTGHEIESNSMLGDEYSVFSSDTNFLDETFDIDKLNILEGSEIYFWPVAGMDNMVEQKEDRLDHQIEAVESGNIFHKLKTLSKSFNYETPCIEVDPSHEAAFNYVRKVLELSGFTGFESLGTWYSDDQPVNPSIYEELEGCLLLDPDCSGNCDEDGHCNHLLLFDIVNEGLLKIFGRSYSYYPKPLSSLSHVHPFPVGESVLKKVWTLISWYLNSTSDEVYPTLDYYVSKDLEKNDGWMNLQFDSECVALELDDLIFDHLIEEIIYT